MCGIAGFCAPGRNLTAQERYHKNVLETMNRVQKHRGPDEEGVYLSKHCGLAHVRLSILDLARGQQPMAKKKGTKSVVIVYNGEIYNMRTLQKELIKEGEEFRTTSDTEVILNGYCRYGKEFFKRLNGIFAFAIWDEEKEMLMLVRDRLGVKPLFYAFHENILYFSSEIKGILSVPGFSAQIDHEGLCEVFALGPAKTPGKGVFYGIKEVRAGSILTFSAHSLDGENHLLEAGGKRTYRKFCTDGGAYDLASNRCCALTDALGYSDQHFFVRGRGLKPCHGDLCGGIKKRGKDT